MTSYSHDCTVFSLFTSISHPLSFLLAACANRAEWQANQRYRNLKKSWHAMCLTLGSAWFCLSMKPKTSLTFAFSKREIYESRTTIYGVCIQLNRTKPFHFIRKRRQGLTGTPSRQNSRLEERREGRGDLLHFCVNRNILWGTFGAKLR